MNTYRIVYVSRTNGMFPIVIRLDGNRLTEIKEKAMHLKDSMAQLGVIPQSGVRVEVCLEFRKGKKIRTFQV